MATILISFLGTGDYRPARYQVDGQTSEPETFFSAAFAAALRPDLVISLETHAASAKHGSGLALRFSALGIEHRPVEIPKDESEQEIWDIFETLTAQVPAESELHLDITHGFRSLPLLGFIALSYLRVTRRVRIGGIRYGAWEARDENDIAPVFDLTPFLNLLDWTAAADEFLQSGSAVRLGNLLSRAQQSLWQRPGEGDRPDLPRKLKSLGGSLKETSSNLLLLRTGALASSTGKLAGLLEETRSEAAAHASPFLELLAPVQEQLTRFGSTDLETLRELVGWLAERGQTAAALTLASEWLTSYAMVKCGERNHHTGYKEREPYSLAIAKIENPDIGIKENEAGQLALKAIEHLEKEQTCLKTIASTIRNARNDLNHAGFNESPAPAAALAQRARDVARQLSRLPL